MILDFHSCNNMLVVHALQLSVYIEVRAYHSHRYKKQAETVSNCSQSGDPVCLVMHEWMSSRNENHEITAEDSIQSLLDGITTQDLDAFCDDEKENRQPQSRLFTSGQNFEAQSFDIKQTVVSFPSSHSHVHSMLSTLPQVAFYNTPPSTSSLGSN